MFEEMPIETVKRRAVAGIMALLARNFFLQIVNLIAFGFFGAFLTAADFGAYIAVSAIKGFFSYFSDIGLAAALIQKKKPPTDDELKTTFVVQQSMVLLVIAVIFLATPIFQKIYGLSKEGIYLLWALSISLFLSSLKTIPSILLERRLEFKKLVVSQMIELISFNTIAVFMAAQGAGITSFTFAVLISGIVGVVVIYIIQPWMPGFAFSLRSLKSLLGFGIPYQANSFLAMIKDDGLTAFLGGILGSSGLGFYAWAQKWINMTLRTVLDPTVKVTFPAYSRLQSQQEELAKAVSKSIFYICLFTYPALAGLVLVAPILVRVVPRYEKWEPALFILGLFAINAFWAAVTTPLTNLLNAIGKIKIHFKLMVMWTVLSWLIIPGFGMKFGITGAAFGTAIVGTSSIIAIWIARRLVPFDVIRSVGQPLFATLVMSLAIFVLRNLFPPSFLFVFLLVAFAVFFYFGLIFWLAGNRLISDFHYMLQARLPS